MMDKWLEITILGCGSSGGVPRVGGDWGACDSDEPKNRRRRCSILVEFWQGDESVPKSDRTCVLVDTSPDLREQLLDVQIDHIDALLYTHDHGDQTHGIDDLRAVSYGQGKRIPTFMDKPTAEVLLRRFDYCFETPKGRKHPPILDKQEPIKPGQKLELSGAGGELSVFVFEAGHGTINSLGFVFCDKIGYLPDAHTISEQTFDKITGLDIWVLDALRYHEHPTHAHIDKSLQWGARAQVKKIIFTNLHIDMDYKTLQKELPGKHEPAFDGMKIKIKV